MRHDGVMRENTSEQEVTGPEIEDLLCLKERKRKKFCRGDDDVM